MSFTNDDILTLAKAGFSAEQIAALSTINQPGPAPTPAPATPAEPAPTPTPTPAPATPVEPTPTPAPEDQPKQSATVDDVLGAINALSKTFQTGFLQGAEQPQPVTAESILAEIINPPTEDSK